MVTTPSVPSLDHAPADDVLSDVLRRFPLVARPHLPCASLDARIAEVADLADAATSSADPDGLVAVAFNKAALIASDQRLPDLARELCWRHHHRYTTIQPWNARRARLALEPLINLARLSIRHSRADDAITLLTTLTHALDTAEPTVIDGHTVHVTGPTPDTADHHNIRVWLWNLVLSEGLRALASAGRWHDALEHAQRHHGIGRRLLDGRQIAIAAHTASHEHDRAAHIITESELPTHWERAVAAALTVINPGANRPAGIVAMINRYLDIRLDDQHSLFAVRLGLAAFDLAADHPDAARIADRIGALTRNNGDAYIARAIAKHPVSATFSRTEQARLQAAIHSASLDTEPHPMLQHRLLAALNRCPTSHQLTEIRTILHSTTDKEGNLT